MARQTFQLTGGSSLSADFETRGESTLADTNEAYSVNLVPESLGLIKAIETNSENFEGDIVRLGRWCKFLRRFTDDSRVVLITKLKEFLVVSEKNGSCFCLTEGLVHLTRSKDVEGAIRLSVNWLINPTDEES